MFSILFTDQGAPCKAAIAAACVNKAQLRNVSATVASEAQETDRKFIEQLFIENELEWPSQIISISAYNPFEYDLIISLSHASDIPYPELPGNALLVNWHVDDPIEDINDPKRVIQSWQSIIERIDNLVEDLFGQGYFNAFIQAKRNRELILDNLSEGIIAHGLNRQFFYLNAAAERITGLTKSEIQGKDCHDIFPNKFCSSHCHFCEDSLVPLFPTKPYPLTVKNKNGEERLVEMSVVPLKDNNNLPIGVVASMKDITREHNLATRLGEVEQFSGIVGKCKKMQEIFQTIRELSKSDVSVLIQGESGTGKELVASAIHNEGTRSHKRFVTVNCGALPDTLLETELFGHVKGAFTGAIRDKKGRFELADGGTLFLDEIGDISPSMQVKLLRVLQDGTLQRLGSEKTTTVNVRVIAATNKNLKEEIEAGRFREDLFYRLSVVPVYLPPLRDRRSDINLLASHFLKEEVDDKLDKKPFLSQETLDLLQEYHWPGNVRELLNIIRYLLVKCPNEKIEPSYLPPDIQEKQIALTRVVTPSKGKREKLDRQAVLDALQECKGNKVKAAKLLKVGRATLYRFLTKYQINTNHY